MPLQAARIPFASLFAPAVVLALSGAARREARFVLLSPALACLVAALKDLTSYTIPNWISLALLAALIVSARVRLERQRAQLDELYLSLEE